MRDACDIAAAEGVPSDRVDRARGRSPVTALPVAGLADLARIPGVSVGTVSRSLAGNAIIATATRQRIVALAEMHGVRVNQAARNMRLERTGAIGVVLPLGHEAGQHVSDPFFMALLGPLADAVADRGRDLLLSRVIPRDDSALPPDGRLGRGTAGHDASDGEIGKFHRRRLGGAPSARARPDTPRLLWQSDVFEYAARHAGCRAAAGLDPPMLLPVHVTSDASYAAIGGCRRSRNSRPAMATCRLAAS